MNMNLVVDVLSLLWQAEHEPEALDRAQENVRETLRRGEPSSDDLVKLATVGRCLLETALQLQGEQLLAEAKAAPPEYVPQEGDWAIWLGKHVVRVTEVEWVTVVNDVGDESYISQAKIRTAGNRVIPVSPRELALYRREGEAPPGDFGLASG